MMPHDLNQTKILDQERTLLSRQVTQGDQGDLNLHMLYIKMHNSVSKRHGSASLYAEFNKQTSKGKVNTDIF